MGWDRKDKKDWDKTRHDAAVKPHAGFIRIIRAENGGDDGEHGRTAGWQYAANPVMPVVWRGAVDQP